MENMKITVVITYFFHIFADTERGSHDTEYNGPCPEEEKYNFYFLTATVEDVSEILWIKDKNILTDKANRLFSRLQIH